LAAGGEEIRSDYEWTAPRPVETLAGVSGTQSEAAAGLLARKKAKGESLTPAEARAFLEQITRSLKGGQS
jgi:hypothetical protein